MAAFTLAYGTFFLDSLLGNLDISVQSFPYPSLKKGAAVKFQKHIAVKPMKVFC